MQGPPSKGELSVLLMLARQQSGVFRGADGDNYICTSHHSSRGLVDCFSCAVPCHIITGFSPGLDHAGPFWDDSSLFTTDISV